MVVVTSNSIQQKNQKSKPAFLRKLPLLDFTTSLYPDANLKDVYIICAQHLASTTYSLFHTFLQLGLQPDNLSTIGKCYSTDPVVYEEMARIGIDVCPNSLTFNSHLSFDEQYHENIKKFVDQRIRKITSRDFKKVIVIDDGGELISAVNTFSESENLIGIEQTSSGFHKLKTRKIKFPIINVARSSAKLKYESPFIARSIIDTLVRRMECFPFKPKKILIIGYGPIGSQIFEILKNDYYVSIFDKSTARSQIKKEHFVDSLKEFDLIIGCTGKTVLEPKHYKLLKENVILVSTSSSDREFSAVSLRNKLPHVINCHSNLFIDGVYLINCGFPINFAEEYREVDVDELQLTRSLILASLLQACNYVDSPKKGFISMNLGNQRKIVQKYLSIFAQ